jgi:hypothetical protein
MKKSITLLSILLFFVLGAADAQYYGGRVIIERGYRKPPRPYHRYPQKRLQQNFHPTVNLSVGYGFPNLDKNYFPDQFNGNTSAYRGNTFNQTGPITGALDFQFSRYNSIGIMGTYGKVSAPFFDDNAGSNVPAFNGNIKSWSALLNMMTYFPTYEKTVSPYIRTAIGINSRNEDYTYPDGSKAAEGGKDITDLAYQVSLGARFNFSPNAGFFLEAGYGRYIASGGLTFRF